MKSFCTRVQMSWTHALRQIVINCYKYHGREDLLPAFSDDEDKGPSSHSVSILSNYLHYTKVYSFKTILECYDISFHVTVQL